MVCAPCAAYESLYVLYGDKYEQKDYYHSNNERSKLFAIKYRELVSKVFDFKEAVPTDMDKTASACN